MLKLLAVTALATLGAAAWSAPKTVTLSVPTMDCPVCPITVKKALVKVSGVSQATDTLIADLVSSVSIEPGTFALTLNTPGAGAVTLADVRQVF